MTHRFDDDGGDEYDDWNPGSHEHPSELYDDQLRTGYQWCSVCGSRTFHDWHSGITNQEFETYPPDASIPDDVFGCNRCFSGLTDEEWEEANNTDSCY